MSNPVTTRNCSDEQKNVMAQMAVNSYLSSSNPRESQSEIQTISWYIADNLREMATSGNGGFEVERAWIDESISKAFSKLQSRDTKTFLIIADSTSWVQQMPEPSLSVQEIIGYLENLVIPYAGKLAERLRYLYEVREEELPEEQPLSPDSMFSFYLFMKQNPNPAYPQVTLTYEGDIHAVWRKSENQLLAIDFVGKSDIRYVLFAPNRKRPGRFVRVSAQTTRDHLLEEITHYQANWVYKQG